MVSHGQFISAVKILLGYPHMEVTSKEDGHKYLDWRSPGKMVSNSTPELLTSDHAMTGSSKGRADKAEITKGGIDLNAKKMALLVTHEDKGISMKFDPALIAEFRRGDFSGIVPVIIRITPLKSVYPILQLEANPALN